MPSLSLSLPICTSSSELNSSILVRSVSKKCIGVVFPGECELFKVLRALHLTCNSGREIKPAHKGEKERGRREKERRDKDRGKEQGRNKRGKNSKKKRKKREKERKERKILVPSQSEDEVNTMTSKLLS